MKISVHEIDFMNLGFRFDSLESSSGERLISVLRSVTFPTERIMKRFHSTFSVKVHGSGSKTEPPRDPWSRWCLVHPLNFRAGRVLSTTSSRLYSNLFMLLYCCGKWGLSPLKTLQLFKRVRITFFGTPLASVRTQARNSSDEKNSGRLNKKRTSFDVNSSNNHFRNRNLKRVVRFPDEITCQYTTSRPDMGAGVLDLTKNSRNPSRRALIKADRWASGVLSGFFIGSISQGEFHTPNADFGPVS